MSQELNKEQIEKIQRETIRAVLNMCSSEYNDFYHNEPNDYGTINLTLWTGEGDPKVYMGKENTARYHGGVIRGTGSYKLNEAAVEMLLQRINEKE